MDIKYKIVETIEHNDVFVSYVPYLWVNNDGTLCWPPWLNPNRKDMSTPDGSWNRYQCKVLRECETLEEAKEWEKRYSKHRDSNSFREAEAQKQNKRDHPVNYGENNSDLINVTDMISKIDKNSGKDADERKKLPSKIPKIIPKNSKRHSGRIVKHSKYQTTGTANLKKSVGMKNVLPLQVKPSIPLQLKSQTTSQRETLGGKKINRIAETDDTAGKKGSQNKTVPKSSKYHSNCTITSNKESGTANLKEFQFDFIPVKTIVPPKPVKTIIPPKPVKTIVPPKPVKTIVPPKSNSLLMKNKTNETSKTGSCNGKTVGNVEKKLSATNTESLSFDENRDYVMSFLKKYHTMYMSNEDNVKDSFGLTVEKQNQNSSNRNQHTEEMYRMSDLVDDGPLIGVGKRSKNDVDTQENASGNKNQKDSLPKPLKRNKNMKALLTHSRKPAENKNRKDSLPKPPKQNKTMKALLTHSRKPAKVCGGQWTVESVGKNISEIRTRPLANSDENRERIRNNNKRNDTTKATDMNSSLRERYENDSNSVTPNFVQSIKTNKSRDCVAQPMVKPASTSTDADFQSKVLYAVEGIQKFCENTEQKRIAFEAKIQASFDTFTRQNLNRYNPAPVRAPVHAPIRKPIPIQVAGRAPVRVRDRLVARAPFRASSRPPVREPIQLDEDEDEMEEFDRHFAIRSKDNLEELEWALISDLDVKRKLLYRFNEFGGDDEKAAIRLKMKYLVHDTVLDFYTWRGTTTDPPKDAFKKLVNINNLIFRSVREQFPDYKRSAYNKYLVEWLKHSTTRQRKVIYRYPQHYQRVNENDSDSDRDVGSDRDQNGDEYGNEYGNDYDDGDNENE